MTPAPLYNADYAVMAAACQTGISGGTKSRLGTYSARIDVDPPPGLKPLSAYKIAAGYLQFVSDAQRLAQLRKTFEAYTGPVVNKGGVR